VKSSVQHRVSHDGFLDTMARPLVAFLASFALDPGNALSGYTAALHKPTARLGNRCSFT